MYRSLSETPICPSSGRSRWQGPTTWSRERSNSRGVASSARPPRLMSRTRAGSYRSALPGIGTRQMAGRPPDGFRRGRASALYAQHAPGQAKPERRPALVVHRFGTRQRELDLGAVEESDDDDVPCQRDRTLHVAGAGAVENDRFTRRIHVQHVAHGEAGRVVVIQRDERAATAQFIEQRRDPVPAMKRKAVQRGGFGLGKRRDQAHVLIGADAAARSTARVVCSHGSDRPRISASAASMRRRSSMRRRLSCGRSSGDATEAAFSDATSALQRSSWRSTSSQSEFRAASSIDWLAWAICS